MVAFIRSVYIIVLVSILGGTMVLFWNTEHKQPVISYNDFLTSLDNNEIAQVNFKGGDITLTDTFGRKFSTYSPDVPRLLPKLLAKNVVIHGESDRPSPVWNLLTVVIPVSLIILAWFFLARKQIKSEDDSDFVKDKAIQFSRGGKQITFRDVAGVQEVKEELMEIIDFLQKPKKYSKLGAVIPHGVLFQGPPGTGKTLLARAIAGEAGVPFFSISGSDFVEMFVGVGASRVRDLFREAKKNTPCIIFIDEIDAVGGQRTAGGTTGGGDERGQTLNALLVEMDGFATDETIIILAATNRPDILDPALLRPGRFDRQVNVLPPDVKGRLAILKVHTRKVPLAKDVDLESVARGTPGFTGAELASLVNEAAILAGRSDKKFIEDQDFDVAKDRILMGIERVGMVIREKDRKTMAYHEAGHAILAKFLPSADPLHKISIIPRGKALGSTQQLAMDDRHAYSKGYLLSRITILMGGRVAEEIALNQQTTGAEDDFQQAVQIATKMVCNWGMVDEIGPISYAIDDGGFLSEHMVRGQYSEETARRIDQEVKRLVEECYCKAREILQRERDFLGRLADTLLVNETLDREEVDIIYACTAQKRSEQVEDEGQEDKVFADLKAWDQNHVLS
ncbi:ATP-dependent zinc metalloprotease FtsH [bacterium BMS3Bbin14]|nr:ATP-dependent zinc metalloprotease FtsH [bacterium BMS3Abin13]GBE52169.1 ATP-dependent zinc metalloprotease FtsH [bacterium BMS3Bbin14]